MMTTVTFDTLKFMRKLEEAGFEEKQAEAVCSAFIDAHGESELATKRDIEDMRRNTREIEQRLTIDLDALIALAIGLVAA